MQPIRIKGGDFIDEYGRVVQLRGVNLDSSVKTPFNTRTVEPIDYECDQSLTFVNHPLPLEEVDVHINRLKSLGYNMIRFPLTWESIEHKGPGQYDFEYIDYVVKVLEKINAIGGVYVYLDPHQDAWSRACGGSGAPLWTLHCAGFNPGKFRETHAAVLHSDYVDLSTMEESKTTPYPKMLWPTNYYKLACQTMFTLFFGGRIFAPKCTINGLNIQDYLQEHFIDAFLALYRRILAIAPEVITNNCVIGFETMNEPSNGYIGVPDITKLPDDRDLKLGGTPTALESFALGAGFSCTIDWYKLSLLGLTKEKRVSMNRSKTNCWLNKEGRSRLDIKYGWIRGTEWIAGKCIWQLHGVWSADQQGKPMALKVDYFTSPPSLSEKINERYFIDKLFLNYYERFYYKFRAISKEGIIIIEAPVFKLPPRLIGSKIMDGRIVCAGHFYDGYTIMFKKWSGYFTINTYGMVKKKYSNPVFSIALGNRNVKNCIRNQLLEMKEDAQMMLGSDVPMIFTEIGAPYDLDEKRAYATADFTSQISALDAVGYGLEANNFSYSIWCYNHENSHKWGDNWNNEDFSMWSKDDIKANIRMVEDFKINSNKITDLAIADDEPPNNFGVIFSESDLNGFRTLDSILRPFPMCINGKFQSAEFSINRECYQLKIYSHGSQHGTMIFIPRYHFQVENCKIIITSGKMSYNPKYQVLNWYSVEKGNQSLQVIGKTNSEKQNCIIC